MKSYVMDVSKWLTQRLRLADLSNFRFQLQALSQKFCDLSQVGLFGSAEWDLRASANARSARTAQNQENTL